LGRSNIVTDLVVWGYDATGGSINNEAKTIQVSFSNNFGKTFGTPITLTHAQTGIHSERLSFGGQYQATTVRLEITDNYFTAGMIAGDRVGLGEVKFVTLTLNDQRGVTRAIDGPDADTTATPDIGAFEAQASISNVGDQSFNEDNSVNVAVAVGNG